MKNELPPVAIFGATGFVGANLAALLTRRGFGVAGYGSADCNLCDPVAVSALVRGLEPGTVVVVCATVNRKIDDSFFALTQNLAMAENLTATLPKARVGGLIFLSTVDVYGRAPVTPINETTLTRPENYYGIGKLASELIFRRPDAFDCPVTVLRFPGVYGPGDKQSSIVGAFLSRIVGEQPITLYGDGSVLRDYVEVNDVCKVVAHFVRTPENRTLNVVSGSSLPLREWIDTLGHVSGQAPKIERRDQETASAGDLVFDNKALRDQVGAEVQFCAPLDGARRYLAHLMDQNRR